MNDYGINNYNEGDIVSCQYGNTDSFIKGTLNGDNNLYIGRSGRSLLSLLREGWTVTTIKKFVPKVVVPKATVKFADGTVAVWKQSILGWLVAGEIHAWGSSDDLVKSFGSKFTILEPIPETAKKVLDRVRQTGTFWSGSENLTSIGAEFGVSE